MAKSVNLSISTLPEDYYARVSKGYLVGIQSSFERYLLAFKELCGNPTENIEVYDPKKQNTNRLQWTLKACYGNALPDDIREYYHICNYYRLTRNHSVHSGDQSAEYKNARALVGNLNRALLKSGMCDRLDAPNSIECLTFDESIISVAGTVSDDVRKRNTKIVNFLAQTYPAKNQPELVDCLQSFVL